MEFQILGPVEARREGSRVALSGTKVHTVLATLLLARGRVVSDAKLSSLLWGWDPPTTMNAQIYTYVSRLRKLLGPDVELIRRPPGYVIETRGAHTDLVEFERLEYRGREALGGSRFAEASDLLRTALGMWKGSALANVTSHLADAELPRLEEIRTTAVEHAVEADLALGRHEQIVPELTALVSELPVRERLRALLMTALYRCGRQADALHVYQEGRNVLADELGVDPGAGLNATYHALLSGALDLAHGSATSAADPRSRATVAARRPTMLPADVPDFAGRERLLADVCARLSAPSDSQSGLRPSRLLLTGMAGAGKTTVAVRAAHATAAHYPDGQLYADLCFPNGTPKSPRKVIAQLLRALDEPALADCGDTTYDLDELVRLYRARTAGKRLLLLLDNATSDLQMEPLLPGTSEPVVLVTSRTRLATVPGSDTTVVPPMTPDDGVAMLAAVVEPTRIAAERDAARDIVAYCAGLPLALRIVGARLAARPHWPVARLAQRLDAPATRLHELRFGDLSVGQTLRSSLERLHSGVGHSLIRLADLDPAGFSAEDAAEALNVPDREAEELLESLVDAALLEMPGLDDSGWPRYRFHELVMLFAGSMVTTPSVSAAIPRPRSPWLTTPQRGSALVS